MANQRWKVTLVVDVMDGHHPQDFVPDAVLSALADGEDISDHRFEKVEADFSFPSEEG